MVFDVAASILNDAAVELGLWSVDLADPFDNLDANAVQLHRGLKSAGQRLVRAHPWTHLLKTHVFTTDPGTADYAMPDDYARTVDQTHWNRSSSTRLLGPASTQGWSYLKRGVPGATTDSVFRVVGSRFHLEPTPASAVELAFDYVSSRWVTQAESGLMSDAPTDGQDTLHFDRQLLIAATKLVWLRNKQFDTAAAQEDFDEALSLAIGADTVASRLSLSGPRGPKLLDWGNVPEGGWG